MGTLKSIAQATGFSITTVSRALGGYADVSEETRRVIKREARKQGYEPNMDDRALRGQRSQAIALVLPGYGDSYSDPFFGSFIAGVGDEAGTMDFDLLLSTHTPDPGEFDIYHRVISRQRADGLILVRTRYEDARINFLMQSGIPFVVFGRTHNHSDAYPYIDIDGVAAQRTLTQHLIDLSHRRIAYISAPLDLTFARYRLQGYRQALEENGLSFDKLLILEGDLTERGGRETVQMLLNLPDPPTAIMTGNDLMAFGAMGFIQGRGLQVGSDIAVAGFDDIPSAEHFPPGLTTMRQPIYAIARQLTQMLIQLVQGKKLPLASSILLPQLIVRGSSGSGR